MAKNCCYCGRPVQDKEYGTVILKDGQPVCRDCADKTRILYPFRYTYVLTKSTIRQDGPARKRRFMITSYNSSGSIR